MTRVRKATAGQPAVEFVPIDAALFVTVDTTDPSWEDPENVAEYHRDLEGAFVRVRPPAEASDATIARVVAELKSVARIVRVDPKPRPEVVPAASHANPLPAVIRAREVVLQLVEESYSNDREALRAFCEEVMGKVSM